jgi:hypothetical protein
VTLADAVPRAYWTLVAGHSQPFVPLCHLTPGSVRSIMRPMLTVPSSGETAESVPDEVG